MENKHTILYLGIFLHQVLPGRVTTFAVLFYYLFFFKSRNSMRIMTCLVLSCHIYIVLLERCCREGGELAGLVIQFVSGCILHSFRV